MTDVRDFVRRSREAATRDAFDRRVDDQAAKLRADIEAGQLNSEKFTLGLEVEVYAVDAEGRLAPVPNAVLDACTKEIGVHNAELNTAPSPFDETGVTTQAQELDERLAAANEAAANEGLRLVPDALWTIPPAEGSRAYLGAIEPNPGPGSRANVADGRDTAVGDADDVVIASNMRTDARYHALDNDVLDHDSPVSISAPGATIEPETVFLESLATSMQPHLLVPNAGDFPAYFNAAIRSLGPVLALGTNAPFLPADCYEAGHGRADSPDEVGLTDDGIDSIEANDPLAVVDRAPHELRIPIFEQSMNVDSPGKVRVPWDIGSATEIVDRLLDDRACAPFLREWVAGEASADVEADSGPGADLNDGERTGKEVSTATATNGDIDTDTDAGEEYAAGLWELDYKRSTYWRWVRPVFGGTPVQGACDGRSLRIEYRPLPTQPSTEDVVGLTVFVAGLLRGIVATDHPVSALPWEDAKRCFYDVVSNGFDADLAWVTQDGERTSDLDAVYEDLFAVAREGLAEQGVTDETAGRYLRPLEARVDAHTAPSDWKRRNVRERVEAGDDVETAIIGMQREYIERAGTPFVEWL